MHRTPRFLLWLAPATMLACAVALQSNVNSPDAPRAPEPPRPSVNHKHHIDQDLICSDCHDPEETGTPALPDPETCFECHEKDLAEESDRVRAYFLAVQQPDGSFKFSRPAYMPGLIVKHEEHASYEVDCASCHGPPLTTAYPRPNPLEFMTKCMDCHEKRGKPERNTCETCHEDARIDRPPASHDVPGFLSNHREVAPRRWREGEGESCGICHDVPDACNACHKESMPPSHKEPGWSRLHGREDLVGRERPFAELSCALCHEEQACSACHHTKKPRSHTPSWERQFHGFHADLDRRSCQTCHKQDFCQSCHESTEPISHRGNWDDAHCLYCHEPLPSNGCFACHKNTLGHLTAPLQPANAIHGGAADPSDCLSCHVVLPHFDSGGRCGTCHR